ncbi:TPA: hypothetical protein VCA30_002558 [Bacillus cereus]|uniref:hypothetical protein n=1 Tax=Bacillus cereus group TaxID=86661 RepID=UPI000BF8DD2C|nr:MULTISPECIES: hypothetical protein [Bacillus cereus group]MBG9841822.1 hypothetical protein [Bacillus tropicus]MBG9875262.1 hypothetical protein [Bacillus tropicus]MBG9920518.1 hypothetical protein [Bacillus tropicus]MBJ8355396.1 hypothetical protein [Bacillus mycoides]MED2899398.1 hypothetical protein [Bacillus tropicus]
MVYILLLFWLSFVAGVIIPWFAKKVFQFCLLQKYPKDRVMALTPLWFFWDLLFIIVTGAFVLLFYIGKLFS